jgi:putative aldouronate transport system permease protein
MAAMWHITISEIRPIISVLLIISMGNLTNLGFERVYLLYNPSVYETADVLQTYIYRRGIGGMEYGYAGAVGLFNTVISVILLLTANYLSKKASEQSIW